MRIGSNPIARTIIPPIFYDRKVVMGTIVLITLFIICLNLVDRADKIGEKSQGWKYWGLLTLGVSGANICAIGIVFGVWIW